MRSLWTLILALVIALPLTACGKKGDLEAPPGKKTEYPRTYPR